MTSIDSPHAPLDQSPYAIRIPVQQVDLLKRKKAFLGRLDIELTERCNNNCIHCYINRPADDPRAMAAELTAERLEAILREAEALGCMSVRFSGGEPLLRPDFERLYLFTRRLGIRVILFTNGTLIDPALADLLARIPPREKIEITLYGMRAESYEVVSRVPGSFAAAMRGVDLLRERNVPFILKGAWLRDSAEELAAFEALCATIPWMEGKPVSHSLLFDQRARRDSPRRNEAIRALRPSVAESLRVITRQGETYIKEMRQFCGKFTRPPGKTLLSCGSGVGGACLDACGKLQLCMLLRHPDAVIDMAHHTLREVMAEHFPRLRRMEAENPDYLRRCASCFLKGLCEQCPGKSWMEHGTLDTPVEYLCQVTHAQARYLGLLGDQEMTWEVVDWKTRLKSFSEGTDMRKGR